MIYCTECYKKLAYNTVYCYHCGTKNRARKKVSPTSTHPKSIKHNAFDIPRNQSLWATLLNFLFSKNNSA